MNKVEFLARNKRPCRVRIFLGVIPTYIACSLFFAPNFFSGKWETVNDLLIPTIAYIIVAPLISIMDILRYRIYITKVELENNIFKIEYFDYCKYISIISVLDKVEIKYEYDDMAAKGNLRVIDLTVDGTKIRQYEIGDWDRDKMSEFIEIFNSFPRSA